MEFGISVPRSGSGWPRLAKQSLEPAILACKHHHRIIVVKFKSNVINHIL
jgi:hypothetical protein